VGSRRQGERPGESRPGDGRSDSGVDGSAGGWQGVSNRGSASQTCGHPIIVAGSADQCAPHWHGGRTASTRVPAGRTGTGCGGFGSHRAGKGGASPHGFEYVGAGYCPSPTIDSRLVPLGIRETTVFVDSLDGAPASPGRPASCPCPCASGRVQFRSAGSSRWFFRDAALRRTALGPHAASRHGPATRWPSADRRGTAP
jgi:hypothetical protein